MKELTAWIKAIIDSQGSPSFGRASSSVVIYFLIVWACYLVSKNGIIPDIPPNWLLLILSLYGVSKAGDTIQAVKGVTNDTGTNQGQV